MQKSVIPNEGYISSLVNSPQQTYEDMCALIDYVKEDLGPFWDSLAEFAKEVFKFLQETPPDTADDPFHKLRLYVIMYILGMIPEPLERIKREYHEAKIPLHFKESADNFFNCLPNWVQEDQKSNFSSLCPTPTSQAMAIQMIDGRVQSMIQVVLYGQSPPSSGPI